MFSSSVINTAAAASAAATGSSNLTHHHHQHQHQQLHQVVSSYYSDVLFSDHHHHYTNLQVPGMIAAAAQDAQQHDDDEIQVPIESTITFITPLGNTIMEKKPAGSDARPVTKKKKSDKRSKIRTSQGLRDRRVRLSIEIARKFFDLQDLLGFDKPSRTVEWLLNKSNKAILELSVGASTSSTTPISSEAVPGTEDIGFKSLSSCTCCTDQIQQVSSNDYMKTMKQQEALLSIKESRERARARARARTLAKLCSQYSSKLDTYSTEKLDQERRKEEEQMIHKQLQLQIHGYVVPNSNLSLDHSWDISSVIPLPSSSSATNRLNLSRDVEIYSRASWDQLLLHNYRSTL